MSEIVTFVNNHPVLVLVWVGLLAMLLVGEFRRLTRKYKEITTLEATRLVNQHNALLVDVRDAKDYAQAHAVGAVHVPLDQVSPDHPKLAEHDGPVVFYCYSGMSSQRAAAALANAGREQIYSLQGGFGAWQGENLPVASQRKPGKRKKKK